MNKNTIIGFILMALVLFGYGWYMQPSEEEIAEQMRQDSIAQARKEKAEIDRISREAEKLQQQQAAAAGDTTQLFYGALNGENRQVTLRNEKVELTIDTKGGVVKKAKILGFADREGNPDVTYFEGNDQDLNFMLAAKETNIVTGDLYFTPSEVSDTTVTLTARAGTRGALILKYTLGENYLLHFSLQTEGLAGLFSPNYKEMDVAWTANCKQQEKGFVFENRYATLTYKESGGGTDHLSEVSQKTKEPDEALDWLAFKDQFFSAVLISKGDIAPRPRLESTPFDKTEDLALFTAQTGIQFEHESGYLKHYDANFKVPFDPKGARPSEFELYIGPNDFRILQKVDDESLMGKDLNMEKLVYLGWPIIRWINRWFTVYVFDGLTSLGLNMGIVLILITMLLKLITYPMVKKTYMSSAKMRVLKPKIEEATKQYDKPEDAMQKQQAMMQLYSQYGVSPLSGCLPMLIQMPIWIAMFNFVPNAIQLRGESFLWISDLSTYDPIIEWGRNLWLIGDHLSLTCLLFCGSNVLYSMISMRQQKDQMVGQQAEQMKMMKWMMYLMPVFFFFIFNDYSSGLNFYYFISLLFSATIMWLLRKTTNDAKLLAYLEKRYQQNKNNPAKKKTSGLAARLEAMQRESEELRKKREALRNNNNRR